MGKRLGLDIGTNSIGWAVIDTDDKKILGTGVRVFPEGVVDTGTSREMSKNATRRTNRMIRRQLYRKKMRKIVLLEVLIRYGLCPLVSEDLKKWKNYRKSNKQEFPKDETFKNWLQMDPYELRHRGLYGELTKYEFGRILYHFAHHRGFKSTRKQGSDDGALYKGSGNILGVDDTKDQLNGFNTLGEFLHSLNPKKKEPFRVNSDESGVPLRARGRYTLREWYVHEFNQIWNKQANRLGLNSINVETWSQRTIGNPNNSENRKKITYLKNNNKIFEIINNEDVSLTKIRVMKTVPLHEYLGDPDRGVLFYQKPIQSQKNTVALCTFESSLYFDDKNSKWIPIGKKACPVSHPLFEQYRMEKFINTISYGKNKIKLHETQKAIARKLMLSKDGNFNFLLLKKKLHLADEQFNYEDTAKVPGCYTLKNLISMFGEGVLDDQETLISLWHDLYFYSDNQKLINKFKTSYGISDEEKLNRVEKIILKEGYSRISVKAIKNILPFLQKGYMEDKAIILGGVKNTFGKQWSSLDHEKIVKDVLGILISSQSFEKGERIQEIQGLLITKYGLSQKDCKRLYHPSQSIQEQQYNCKLEPPMPLRNPIVQQALFELRRVVNSIIEKFLKDEEQFERITVELARELRQAKELRVTQYNENNRREERNQVAKEFLNEFGLAHTRENLHKYLLYKEIEERSGVVKCPYTGKTISLTKLLGDSNDFQIEHIIPYSVSLDDSLANKTLCDSYENGRKGELTPYQFYGGDKIKWQEVSERAFQLLPYVKAKRFTNTEDYTTEFLSRHLNDTRYISKAARTYLESICPQVRVTPGSVTSHFRHHWGLDSLISNYFPVYQDVEKGPAVAYFDQEQKERPTRVMPLYNSKPQSVGSEMVIKGEIVNNIFSAKQLNAKYPADVLRDGSCWAKVGVGESMKVVPVFTERPKLQDDQIIINGRIEKGKFISPLLSDAIPCDKDYQGKYRCILKIKKTEIDYHPVDRKKRPENKPQELLVQGEVIDGVFRCFLFEDKADITSGRWWVSLPYDNDDLVFIPMLSDIPETHHEQLLIKGELKDGKIWPENDRFHGYPVNGNYPDGLYWVVFSIKEGPHDFVFTENLIKKSLPKEKLIEGTVTYSEEEKQFLLIPKKNREDQRHHAIDALTIACMEQGFLQRLSEYSKERKAYQRNGVFEKKVTVAPPWPDFRVQAKESIGQILVSYRKDNKVLSKIKKKYQKEGKTFISTGYSARGQLHKEQIYGKHPGKNGEYNFHIRKSISDLKDHKHVNKIVDEGIKKTVLTFLENKGIPIHKEYKIPNGIFFKDEKPLLFLPNKRGEPVPIKKVRIRESLGNAKQLKDTQPNQFVNPSNNHHILIYEDLNGELKESCVTFWEAVKRKAAGKDIYILPEDGRKIVSILEIGEMFLIGIDSENGIADISKEQLSSCLFRVQKLSSMYYTFRHHLASTLNNPEEEVRIQSLSSWKLINPRKTLVTNTGDLIEV